MAYASLAGAVLTRIIVNALAYVFQKKLTMTSHPLFVNMVTYGVLALVSLFVLPWRDLSQLKAEFWLYSVAGGIIGSLGNAYIIKALEKGELSVLGPINAYKSVVGMLVAFILVGELPNAYGLAGIVLIILGSYVVLSHSGQAFSWSVIAQPAIRYRLLALVLTGTQAVIDKKIILLSDLRTAFCSWSVFGFVFAYLLYRSRSSGIPEHIRTIRKTDVWSYMAMVVCIGLMTLSTNYCFAHMPVAEALALFQLSMVITIFFGFSFFRERGILRKLAGTLIMIMGSVLILFKN